MGVTMANLFYFMAAVIFIVAIAAAQVAGLVLAVVFFWKPLLIVVSIVGIFVLGAWCADNPDWEDRS